ncbi:DUF2269 family protein [Parachitinimonas caeni]|uniref:DUF2269 domain-containing protein n=1 Tax=Parachitinimonas caeni TaxID=3031301 RepID=A0ABT7DVS9_9NEIS|nr:DUF2269 domain-containing protein [Parachitinimonas caeni]MDK2124109.1 DUF2269 domain-containing protein [Parachitinimonas caeni]
MDYLTMKWLHILSSTILFGTGIGTAFYMFVANRSGDLRAISVVTRWVVRADWVFTGSTVIFQPLSGWWMAQQAGFEFGFGLANTPLNWLGLTVLLYVMAGACWLPVVWLQIRMRDMAASALASGHALPARYWRYEKIWCVLGIPAFTSLVWVFHLMVVKTI